MLPNSVPRFRTQYGEVKAVARELGIEGKQLGDVAGDSVAQLREATSHVHDSAVQRLEEALTEQDRLGVSFDAAVGTSTEFGAYVRLQRAGEQVAARQTWLHWVDNEAYRGINAGPFELAAEKQPRLA